MTNESIILKKAGKQTLELRQTRHGKRLVVSDGWLTNWIIVYDSGKWAADSGNINAPIRNFLNKNVEKLLKLQS